MRTQGGPPAARDEQIGRSRVGGSAKGSSSFVAEMQQLSKILRPEPRRQSKCRAARSIACQRFATESAAWGRRMDAVVEQQSYVVPNFKPSVEEFAETKRPSCSDIDDLIALVRGNEDNIFLLACERAIDPLTLRSRLLLHLPRFVIGDSVPGE